MEKPKTIPKRLIPYLPEGCRGFNKDELVRRRIRTVVHSINLHEFEGPVENFYAKVKELKKAIRDHAKEAPKGIVFETELEGEPYDGPDRVVLTQWRYEADVEVKWRLERSATSKITALKRRQARVHPTDILERPCRIKN